MSCGCSIYSLKANLSPKKRHRHYIASNPWAFRSKNNKHRSLELWHDRAQLGTDRACLQNKTSKREMGVAHGCVPAGTNHVCHPGICTFAQQWVHNLVLVRHDRA